jgi:MFS family permease
LALLPTSIDDNVSPLPRRWVILVLATLAYATAHLTRWSTGGISKLLIQDFHLDKAAIGTMTAVFFLTYAVVQVPWGWATDRWGARRTVGLGVLLSGATLVGIATSTRFEHLVGWRMACGAFSACNFVPLAALMARWFPRGERALANLVYAGCGAAAGEVLAFWAIPLLSMFGMHASGANSSWQQAHAGFGMLVGLVGLACVLGIRSAPPARTDIVAAAPCRGEGGLPSLLRAPLLWLLGLVAAGFVGGLLRLIPLWLAAYTADIAVEHYRAGVADALKLGGIMLTVHVIARAVVAPLAGKLTDAAVVRFGRLPFAAAGLGVGVACFLVLSFLPTSRGVLLAVAIASGAALSVYTLVNAAASEFWGAQQTGSAAGVINMTAQLLGFVSLLVSGYLGQGLAKEPGNVISEYAPIWWLGVAYCTVAVIACLVAHRLSPRAERAHLA